MFVFFYIEIQRIFAKNTVTTSKINENNYKLQKSKEERLHKLHYAKKQGEKGAKKAVYKVLG